MGSGRLESLKDRPCVPGIVCTLCSCSCPLPEPLRPFSPSPLLQQLLATPAHPSFLLAAGVGEVA